MTDVYSSEPIEPDPDAIDATYLPFQLTESDQPGAAPVASIPVCLPDEWLAAILFLDTLPGQYAPDDRAARWASIAEHLLLAGVERLAARFPSLRELAHTDADTFVWWEQCRDQVRGLFPTAPPPAPRPGADD